MALTTAAAYVNRGAGKGGGEGAAPVFRADYMFWREQQGEYIERRQLFLRSYHFSRKQAPRERVRRTLLRVRRLVWARLRDAGSLPRLLWAKLRAALPFGRGRGRHSRRLAGAQFRSLPLHRRSASNSSSSSSCSCGPSAADWPSW